MTVNCNLSHPFSFDSGYACCSNPTNVLSPGTYLSLDDPISACDENQQIHCPGIPREGLCVETQFPGMYNKRYLS